MADPFSLIVIPVIEKVLSIAASPLDRKIRQLWHSGNLKKELEKLKESLPLMESMLNYADQMQSDKATRVWLQRLQDAAEDLRDLLDEDAYGVYRQKGWIQRQFKKEVRNFLFPSKSMLSKIKEINVSFDRIVQQSDWIRQINQNQNREAPRPKADESFYNIEVLQRDADVLKIESLLVELSRKHDLSGLSIVGMPGVGKTALARSIYERAKENDLYNPVAWVPVHKDFDEEMILRHMLGYLDSHAGAMTGIDPILCHLQKLLKHKKILLILDGLWNEEDARGLKEFISRLPQWFKTARISVVITTSNKEVASIMDTIPLHKHELQKLSDEDCWVIMEENVRRSSNGTPTEDPQLLLIGKDIAKQCGGLPLVAAVFGKKLGAHIGVNEWSAIRDNKAWHAPHREEILSQLKKSYDHLPPHLKRCFSFCSMFPKKFEIRRDELVQCWMANGFLSKSNDSKSDKEEDIGNQYFNDLVSNYLLEDVDVDECGNIKFCKMHDEMHNLALLSAKYGTYIWPDAHPVEGSVRHMRVVSNENLQAVPGDVAQRLRSLFLDVDVLHMMPKKSRSLQSLKLAAADANELQSSLSRLKYYMKYLDISESALKRLPKSVTKLYNLQTLRFTDCNSLEKLPSGIENLVSLRHLYFDDERHLPSSIGKLTSLQTLPIFVVGTEKGWRIEELANLTELRGKLKICKLELVPQSEASKAKLKDKGKLTKLQFVWSKGRANSGKDKDVLDSLQPHSNLKSLTINNYGGGNCPSWMTGKGSPPSSQLNRLVKLKLIDCDQCGDISCLELLPELKVLNIKAMPNVERIGRKSYHQSSSMASSSMASSSQGGGQPIKPFPALRKLKLSNMTRLEEWTGAQGMVVFPCLEELHTGDCPELKKWWASSSQGEGESILPFPALRKLTLIKMTNLEGWKTAEGMVVFSCLEELHIGDCSVLKTWCASNSLGRGDSITPFPALRKLTLSNMTKLEKWTEAQGMVVFPCLEELHIQHCPELKKCWASSSQGGGESILPFPALRKLKLSKMTNLEGWKTAQGMVVFSSLEELHIEDCSVLKTWCASNSQGRGDSLTPFPALRKLTLSNMTKLEKWTEAQGMVVFPCLKELHIQDCPELNTWWQDGSASPYLSILGIQSCRNLQAIPIGLSNLTSLDINNCPKLMEYAQEDSCKWSSICHTRRIRINGQMVRSQRS